MVGARCECSLVREVSVVHVIYMSSLSRLIAYRGRGSKEGSHCDVLAVSSSVFKVAAQGESY